jgi:hypothetical protein
LWQEAKDPLIEAMKVVISLFQGEAESSAVANIWTLKCFSSDPWHSLIVVSFAEATRAFTAGQPFFVKRPQNGKGFSFFQGILDKRQENPNGAITR